MKCPSAYDYLMATLDNVYFAIYYFGQFGCDLATFWVTDTGTDSLMVLKYLGNLQKHYQVTLVLVTFNQNVNKLFMVTNWEK